MKAMAVTIFTGSLTPKFSKFGSATCDPLRRPH